jgi:hypothetical protein
MILPSLQGDVCNYLDSICLFQIRFREDGIGYRSIKTVSRSGTQRLLLEEERHDETEQTREEPNYQNVIDEKHVMEE